MHTKEGYDRRTPVTMHQGLAAAQFIEHFEAMDYGNVLNIAAGQTNLQADIKALLPDSNISVVSLDPAYSEYDWACARIPNKQAGIAQDMPFSDDSFSLTLCQYGIQHMPKSDIPKIVSEMVRVTKRADSVRDESGGTVLLGPVFKSDQLSDYIIKNGLQDVCGIELPSGGVEEHWHAARPALIIKKLPELTADRLAQISSGLMETNATHRKVRSLGELASRATHGHSHV